MISTLLGHALGRASDVAQLGLAHAVTRPLFDHLRRAHPDVVERMRHEPFAARGEAFVKEVGVLEKAGFVAKMLASDGNWSGPRATAPGSDPRPASDAPEMLFAGDVLHPGVVDAASLSDALRARIGRASCFVANLEGTVGDAPHEIAPLLTVRGVRQLLAYEGDPTNDDWASRLDEAGLASLFGRASGRVVLSVANNHTLDEGAPGFDRTVARVERAGIDVVGDARTGDGSIVVELGSRRVGLFAIGYGSNREDRAGHHLRFAAVPYRVDRHRCQAIVDGLRARGATDVVAILHWGHEHEHEPSLEQERATSELFDVGVAAVIGHHAHLVQRSEPIAQRWVSYSLGDFVGGDRTIWSRFAVLVSLRFSDLGVRGEVIPVAQTPFWQRHRTMLLDEAPGLERAVFARYFEGKLP